MAAPNNDEKKKNSSSVEEKFLMAQLLEAVEKSSWIQDLVKTSSGQIVYNAFLLAMTFSLVQVLIIPFGLTCLQFIPRIFRSLFKLIVTKKI